MTEQDLKITQIELYKLFIPLNEPCYFTGPYL